MKHTLLLTAFALVGISSSVIAGPRDASDFALRHAASQAAPPAAVASSDVKYVVTSNGKGGSAITQARDTNTTSIALSKSSNSKGDSCSSCSAKH